MTGRLSDQDRRNLDSAMSGIGGSRVHASYRLERELPDGQTAAVHVDAVFHGTLGWRLIVSDRHHVEIAVVGAPKNLRDLGVYLLPELIDWAAVDEVLVERAGVVATAGAKS